jgi:hypothetical protein
VQFLVNFQLASFFEIKMIDNNLSRILSVTFRKGQFERETITMDFSNITNNQIVFNINEMSKHIFTDFIKNIPSSDNLKITIEYEN